jgi:hypothetical protein
MEQTGSCCGDSDPSACVFTKALLAREAMCELAQRRALGERDWIACTSPVARINCATLAALLRERSTFALKLGRADAPLMHAKAMQLQCGGVSGLQQALGAPEPDVHRLVGQAHEHWGSLLDLPWNDVVSAIAAWQPRRMRRAPPP